MDNQLPTLVVFESFQEVERKKQLLLQQNFSKDTIYDIVIVLRW